MVAERVTTWYAWRLGQGEPNSTTRKLPCAACQLRIPTDTSFSFSNLALPRYCLPRTPAFDCEINRARLSFQISPLPLVVIGAWSLPSDYGPFDNLRPALMNVTQS